MKRRIVVIGALLAVAVGAGLWFYFQRPTKDSGLTKVRIGWQTAWATQGQVTQALKHTDILKQNGIEGEFTGYAYGPPAVEGALAGNLDVVSGGSQPMLQLVAKSNDWVIVSRHSHVRVGLLVPPESDSKTLSDLKGRKIGMPLGTVSERFVILRAKAAGLDSGDFQFVNLGIEEQGEFIRAGTRKSWGEIAGVSAWEPTVTLLERKGLGRVIEVQDDLCLTVMSRNFIRDHPNAAVAYLRATIQAWFYFATHRQEMNEAYLKETALPIDDPMLEAIAGNEPNARVKSLEEIDLSLTPEYLGRLQQTIDLLAQRRLIARSFKIEDVVNSELLRNATQSLSR